MELTLIAIFAGVVVYCLGYPKTVWSDPGKRFALMVFNAMGFFCVAVLFLWFYALKDGLLKDTIHFISTFYFTLIVFSCTVMVLVFVLWVFARLFRAEKLRLWLESYREQMMIAITFLILCLCAYGFMREHQMRETRYSVSTAATDAREELTIGLISDLHLGGGATKATVIEVFDALRESNPDILLISGDLVDSTTSLSDIEVLSQQLSGLHLKYGTVFVSGNHDAECHYEYEPYLLSAGVRVLKNEAMMLDNGVIIAGQLYEDNKPLDEMFQDCGIERGSHSVVVIRHKPQKLKELDGQCDLVVCGHTHGYRYPMIFFTHSLSFDLVYGIMQMDGGTTAITTSGVSCWGFQFKFPSISEVVTIALTPKKATAPQGNAG